MPKLENLADQIYCNSDNKPQVASEFGKFDSRTAAQDRPGLLLRVFCLEIQNLLKILKDGCFGCLEALLYRIECQKRGFTACIYINILLWLSHDAKFDLCNYFFHFICVQCPKPKLYLYNFVTIIFP